MGERIIEIDSPTYFLDSFILDRGYVNFDMIPETDLSRGCSLMEDTCDGDQQSHRRRGYRGCLQRGGGLLRYGDLQGDLRCVTLQFYGAGFRGHSLESSPPSLHPPLGDNGLPHRSRLKRSRQRRPKR